MSDVTGIQWTDHSWSPWFGCTKVSVGCANCYAEADNARYKRNGGGWGKGAPRVLSKGWDKPRQWNRHAEKAGVREKVFPSLCDPWDQEVREEWRVQLFDLIGHTPWLDYLLLTKRIEHVGNRYLPLPNVWIGTSVENQEVANERIPHLLKIRAAVRFLSVEPLLGPIDLSLIRHGSDPDLPVLPDWVIVGGESGHGARPCNVEWIRSIVEQCKAASVPVFVKQLGAKPITKHIGRRWPADVAWTEPGDDFAHPIFDDRKGGDWSEWPEDLRIREFPQANR